MPDDRISFQLHISYVAQSAHFTVHTGTRVMHMYLKFCCQWRKMYKEHRSFNEKEMSGNNINLKIR